MRHYEIVFLVHPDQSEQVPAMIDRYREMVISGEGKVHRVEDWGRRRLAYMINDVHKAHYVMLNIECSLETLRDIERNFKFNDSVLRHLVIKRKGAITEESYFAKEKAAEEQAEAKSRSQKTDQNTNQNTNQNTDRPAAGADGEEQSAEAIEAPVQSKEEAA